MPSNSNLFYSVKVLSDYFFLLLFLHFSFIFHLCVYFPFQRKYKVKMRTWTTFKVLQKKVVGEL